MNKTDKEPFLYEHQRKAVGKMFNGCILNGGTGSGKSRTGLFYHFKENGGWITDDGDHIPMKEPRDLYIITTAMKRDTLPFLSMEEIDYLCPECIASGEAARKYNGAFQDDCSVDDGVDDPQKLDELIHRTPGYSGWQEEYWRAHCGDYCAFLGYAGARELRAMGALEEVLDDPIWDDEQKKMIQESVNGGDLQCYLFQCLHCGKHLVWMDFD